MAHIHLKESSCGPVISCGAASVSLDHRPGDPTSVDKLVGAIKGLTHRMRSRGGKTPSC